MCLSYSLWIITARKRNLGQAYVLHVSVILLTGWGEYLCRYPRQAGTPPGRYTPWQVHPPGRYTPRQVHPQARYTPQAGTLPQVHPQAGTPHGRYNPSAGTPWQGMLGYGQEAGGTHPTGMHSCLMMSFVSNSGSAGTFICTLYVKSVQLLCRITTKHFTSSLHNEFIGGR